MTALRLTESRREPNAFAKRLFAGLPARYDALAEVLSFGQNRRWRSAMADAVVRMQPPPQRILDVATGTAGVALLLAKRTAATIVGIDISEEMLERGRERVRRRELDDRIQLQLGRAEELPFADGEFDALTFTYLLRYVADPAATLRELARVVRPAGTVASLEFFMPPRAFWRAGWYVYTRTLLPTIGFLTGGREWWTVGRFLGPSIHEHYRRYPLDWTVEAWRAAGLTDVTVRPMSLGVGVVMWAHRAVAEDAA